MQVRIGIDAGGTFTDFIVLFADGTLDTYKLRSNPADPAEVILAGLKLANGRARGDVIHGSTVATNALLERKGARTALVTTAGFEDVIQIGRQNRDRLYDLNPPPKRALIPREACFGVPERTYFDGTIGTAVDCSGIELDGFESVAICFLHSYANDSNEKAALEALAGDYYVCASHQVCPEYREYERTSTTVLNAYVGPLMARYLGELEGRTKARLWIMQSNGGLMTPGEARGQAVRTLLSGPAGGVVGAVEAGRASGFRNVLGFDMGGTSTDVSLSEGRPVESMEASIDGFPVRVPMLDIHTVGAGGGSIARVDEGGLLRVGPESAGADPGPACYGKGTDATVTDAHVVLGRIAMDQLVGGEMRLEVARATEAVGRLASRLELAVEDAALGIIRVANANMERAIRTVSIERGHDPRQFALLAFGGCGGLHACEIAEELGIRTVLVPQHAGVLSAFGMLMADRVRDYAAGVVRREDVDRQIAALEKQARTDLPKGRIVRSMDVRYAGQSYELNVPDEGAFHKAHEKTYGYCDRSRPTEIVTIRVRAVEEVAKPRLRAQSARAGEPAVRRVRVGGKWMIVPAWKRQAIGKQRVGGPALVIDYDSTTWVAPGWVAKRDRAGALVITHGAKRRV
jgi:N-methylhydantoinase A/oxoprolinase/acetone carboxylase beta subunit